MGIIVKTSALSLLLALAGATVQAQPAATPPPLPSFPAVPPRTNRAPGANPTNLVPLRGTRTNAPGTAANLGGATNVTSPNAGAATNPANSAAAAAAVTAPLPPPVTPAVAPPTTVINPPGAAAPPPNQTVFGAAAPPPGNPPPLAAPGAARGATNAAEELLPPGLIKFNDADAVQVLDFYQLLTGRTVIRPTSLPLTKISIRTETALTRREAIQALDTILAMNQITMIPQGDKFVKAVPQAQATTEAKEFNELPADELEETTRYITQIVQLKNALPQEVAPALQPLAKLPGSSIMAIPSAGILVLRDYEDNIKRMLELLEKIDVVPQQEYEPIVIPIKYALAADIQQVLASLTVGGGGGGTVVGRQQAGGGLSGGGGT